MRHKPPRSVEIANAPRALPAVRFKKHRTARALVEQFFRPMGGFKNFTEAPAYLKAVRECGLWAFCMTEAKPPVVHYWHAADANRAHLVYVLGHEVGHVSGRPLRSMRNAWREECRADEYGAAAYLAAQHVFGKSAQRKAKP